jgi:hypothetical protein
VAGGNVVEQNTEKKVAKKIKRCKERNKEG